MMRCNICGLAQKYYLQKQVISSQLARAWKITSHEVEAFNRRESSLCHGCGNSLRSRSLARAIMRSFPTGLKSIVFADWVKYAQTKKLKIAEINFCGQLHPYLAKNRHTTTTQYLENTWRAKIFNYLKGIRSQDITALTFPDNSFDLVLHSEVLEHVSDPALALSQCLRVLKPGGICLFTIPLIMSRQTKRKAKLDPSTRRLTYLGKPSYHGSGENDNLVFWEFGGDFLTRYPVKVTYQDPQNMIWVLAMRKPQRS